jgi:hypothetical protein
MRVEDLGGVLLRGAEYSAGMAGAARVLGAYRIRTGEGAGEREAESGDEGAEDRLICGPWGPWCPAFQQKEAGATFFIALPHKKQSWASPHLLIRHL